MTRASSAPGAIRRLSAITASRPPATTAIVADRPRARPEPTSQKESRRSDRESPLLRDSYPRFAITSMAETRRSLLVWGPPTRSESYSAANATNLELRDSRSAWAKQSRAARAGATAGVARRSSGRRARDDSSWRNGATRRPGSPLMLCAPPALSVVSPRTLAGGAGSGSVQAPGRLGQRCCSTSMSGSGVSC